MEILNILEKINCPTRQFRKDEILFHEGDACRSIFVVKNGSIAIRSYTLQGNEVVYNRIQVGEMFGNNLVFDDDNLFRGDVVALEDALIFVLSRDLFVELLQSNKTFLELYLSMQSKIMKMRQQTIKLLSLKNAEERFLFYLQSQRGTIRFKNVSELAKHLQVERETLSRLISRLEKRHQIRRLSHIIELVD